MLAKLPDWKCRQKVKQRIHDDPETSLECFQVSVNIIEAKNLAWARSSTGETYVLVTLGKEKHKTILNNKGKYLLFEWYTDLKEMLRSNLFISVLETRCCAPPRLLGESTVNLGFIWTQPNHQVYHKWAQLTLPRNPNAGTVAFLKVDISIMTRNIEVMSVMVSPENKEYIPSALEDQTASYVTCIYNAFGIAPRLQEARQDKLPSTYVKLTFCGMSVKTAVQMRTSNPCFAERVTITEMFPNNCHSIRFEVCSTDQTMNPVLASVDLNLGQISYDGDNGFVPTFGPSLLHMYGTSILGIETPCGEGPFYRGCLLVALRTIVPYLQQAVQTTSVEPIIPLRLENLFGWHDYCIYCPIFEVSMLNIQPADKRCGVAFTIGEIPSEASMNEDFMLYKQEARKRKLHYTGPVQVANYSCGPYGYMQFTNSYPILQQAIRLPSFEFRIYRNNLVRKITENLERALIDAENRLTNYVHSKPSEILENLSNAINTAADHILKFFEYSRFFDPSSETYRGGDSRYTTELDHKQLALQNEDLEKIYRQIREEIELNSAINLLKTINKTSSECYSISNKHVKALLVESKAFAEKLKALVFKSAHGWPDITVWLLNAGSRFAFHKISISDILYAEFPELRGKDCGRIQSIYLKPLKCPKHFNVVPNTCLCTAGKVELMFWCGLYSEAACFENYIPRGQRLKTRDYDMCVRAPVIMVKLRVFIYRAKLIGKENIIQPSPFVRINVLNMFRETQVQKETSCPIWDQVLTATTMFRSSHERLVCSPPEIMVELYHSESTNTTELIGRAKIFPDMENTKIIEYMPELKWHDITLGEDNVGQILMSALIVQMPETVVKTSTYNSVDEVNDNDTKQDNGNDAESDNVESLPRSLKPVYSIYKVDIYWWGLRDLCITKKPCAVLEIDNLTVKSDVIADRKLNSNFPNGRISHVFQGNLENSYSSPLTVRLFDSSTFGRIISLGTNAVKNPAKYIVSWIPKKERESSLRTASIMSSDFVKVNKTLFIKKPTTPSVSTTECSKMTVPSHVVDKKWSSWRRLFGRVEPEEEKYVLLPMHCEEVHNNTESTSSEIEHVDWWYRFFASQKECERSGIRKIKIYNSELERQSEFSKFKDWCKSLKLYNGKKTGIPEKDADLRCGILKVGIAIYRWPPPHHTEAVSWSGVELDKGYFSNFSSNETAKFLVRVYLVRGLYLAPKDVGECNPFVTVTCGTKHFGDRSDYIQNTINPIFGRVHEFQCSIPEEYKVTMSVYNHDRNGQDTLIGATSVDLEDRIYSKHRGQVGLAAEYNVTGPSKWRDCEKPSEILTKICARNHIDPPTFPDGNTVIVNGIEYREADKTNKTYISATQKKENLCLNLLHKWHTLQLCGYHLVPEHVETRSLLDPENRNLEQVSELEGKLMMWVDIFPMETGLYIPQPVDITPRKVEDYELRVIIWHLQSVGKKSVFSKKAMDLYVKAWIGNAEQAHYTDIHYNCMNGEASFNWRMIFNFQYQQADNKLVLMEKGPFTEYEERIPPVLVVQVSDGDAESIDDYLSTIALDLSAIPRGSRQILRDSDLDNMESANKINLFKTRSIRSWWPLKTVDKDTGAIKFEGMIDMELHLLPKEKATLMPVGIGRDSPFPLPMPHRPDAAQNTLEKNLLQRGAAEYILIGIALTLLVIAMCWKFQTYTRFGFYLG